MSEAVEFIWMGHANEKTQNQAKWGANSLPFLFLSSYYKYMICIYCWRGKTCRKPEQKSGKIHESQAPSERSASAKE